jgi:outer membrane beta-barrel protein
MRQPTLSTLLSSVLATTLVATGLAGTALAQEEEMTFDEDEAMAEPEPEPDLFDDDLPEPDFFDEPDVEGVDVVDPLKADAPVDGQASWQDIVVVVRKPFLKVNRIELLPQWGVTMNDNLIRHVQFNGQINYFLTDVLAVGVEGHLYAKGLREPFDLVARQARRLPTVNQYNWGAALNFHYVPVYGKFAIFDRHIIHWESFFTAGVGVTQSEVLPRDPAFRPFTNFLITPNVGVSMRFFITKFLTVNLGVRDYIFVDSFEPTSRGPGMFESAADAKANADSSLINNVVFQAGLSFWFPMSFEYTTFR